MPDYDVGLARELRNQRCYILCTRFECVRRRWGLGFSVQSQVDEAKPVIWSLLAELQRKTAEIVTAAQRSMQQQAQPRSLRITDERVRENERHGALSTRSSAARQ
jgi:hypothetical protein